MNSTDETVQSSRYWFDDGSVVILADRVLYKVHRSLIERLSPRFFDHENVRKATDASKDLRHEAENKCPTYSLQSESRTTKLTEGFESLLAHLYHDIPLNADASYTHALHLFVTSAAQNFNFPTIHRQAGEILLRRSSDDPLVIDFGDCALLQEALALAESCSGLDDKELARVLRKTLFYAYTVSPDVVFEDDAKETHSTESATDPPIVLAGADAARTARLMGLLAERFSPTLFQPPGASHMRCTDALASNWMDRAVQPAFSAPGGVGDVFGILARWREVDWRGWDASGTTGPEEEQEDGEKAPCDECLKEKRLEWSQEAREIWDSMDGWISEGDNINENVK